MVLHTYTVKSMNTVSARKILSLKLCKLLTITDRHSSSKAKQFSLQRIRILFILLYIYDKARGKKYFPYMISPFYPIVYLPFSSFPFSSFSCDLISSFASSKITRFCEKMLQLCIKFLALIRQYVSCFFLGLQTVCILYNCFYRKLFTRNRRLNFSKLQNEDIKKFPFH